MFSENTGAAVRKIRRNPLTFKGMQRHFGASRRSSATSVGNA